MHLRVVLVHVAILLLIEVLGLLAGVVLGLLRVDEVQSLCLDQLVNLSAGKGS